MTVPITTRAAKGSELEYSEMDANLTAFKNAIETDQANIAALQADVTALEANGSVVEDRLATNSVSTPKIVDKAVTFQKIQDVAANSILGRKSAGTGAIEQLTAQDVLSFLGAAPQGALLYKGPTTWDILTPGTAGQFLQTAGAGSNPLWATVSTGGGGGGGPITVTTYSNRNRLKNGDFSVDQYNSTSIADDAYCIDRWYVLAESGSVGTTRVAFPESGIQWGYRLTQPDATPKRFGLAQIIEARDITQYRGAVMSLSARVKPSFSGAIRYAVIEHTGTADGLTSDIVSNWSSTTFTAGNFFAAGFNIIDTGTVTPGAATYGTLSDNCTLGSSTNNVIIFIWTESAQAQNATLELNSIQFEPGATATNFDYRMNELELCHRYRLVTNGETLESENFAASAGNGVAYANISFPTMRVVPTILSRPSFAAGNCAFNTEKVGLETYGVSYISTGSGRFFFYRSSGSVVLQAEL